MMAGDTQRVIATARGYDGKVVREEGEEFTMPAGATGTWFVSQEHEAEFAPPAEPPPAKPAKKDGKA